MKHSIDPRIDCVFKSLLGNESNRNLLVHFINATLASELIAPITQVEILNPYNEKEHLDDKLSIVDVKAKDEHGRIYQIEIQLLFFSNLPARMLYTWADVYSQQLQSGDKYHELNPTYSIWLLGENAIKHDDQYIHRYKFRDEAGVPLIEHGGIWLFELEKFNAQVIDNEQTRWLRFFKEGKQLNDLNLPDWMNTQEMKQAMNTLCQFSEKERNYFAYQARQDFLRQQGTILFEKDEALEQRDGAFAERDAALVEKEAALAEKGAALAEKGAALAEKEAALAEKEAAIAEVEAAIAEVERLKALLGQK
jgi:predicted transposase/invertase (TIGR01784 family)